MGEGLHPRCIGSFRLVQRAIVTAVNIGEDCGVLGWKGEAPGGIVVGERLVTGHGSEPLTGIALVDSGPVTSGRVAGDGAALFEDLEEAEAVSDEVEDIDLGADNVGEDPEGEGLNLVHVECGDTISWCFHVESTPSKRSTERQPCKGARAEQSGGACLACSTRQSIQ